MAAKTFQLLITLLVVATLTTACDSGPSFSGGEGKKLAANKTSDSANAVVSGGDSEGKNNGDKDADATNGPDTNSPDKGENKDNSNSDDKPQVIEKVFTLNSRESVDLVFQPALKEIEQSVTLASSYTTTNLSFDQQTYENRTKSFRQGTVGVSKTESFTQSSRGILDLQVVIDNSGSMAEEQQNLAERLAPLLESIAESDWRMNIVTTDPKNGCSTQIIMRGDADAETKFKNAINAGLAGDGNEQGIRMAVAGLSCTSTAWTRANSSVAVLIVSDEDNCSNGNGCGTAAWNTENYLLDYLTTSGRRLGTDISAANAAKAQARVYGIFYHPSKACSTGYNKGYQYASAVSKSGGIWGSICDTSYTTTLTQISADIASFLESDFTLAAAPDAGSFQLTINPVPASTPRYAVNGKTLSFIDAPAYNARIDVSYVVGASAIKTRFALGETPVTGSLEVRVSVAGNNSVLAGSAYSFDAATKELVISQAPADNADIYVSYKLDKILPKAFNLGEPKSVIRANSLQVSVAGSPTSAYTLADDGTLTFDVAPEAGSKIVVAFSKYQGPVLNYSLALSGTNPRNFAVTDKDTKEVVAATIESGVLSVPIASHKEGKVLSIRYRTDESLRAELTLTHMPIADSLVLDSQVDGCALNPTVDLENKKISFNPDCLDLLAIKVSYDYALPLARSFTIDGVSDLSKGSWSVSVDDQVIKDFQRQATTIILGDAVVLKQGSVVKIRYASNGE